MLGGDTRRVLKRRLWEPKRFIQAVVGPRQGGKTTLVRRAAVEMGTSFRDLRADERTLRHLIGRATELGWA